MIVTTFPWHWVGILGMPRRMAYFDYSAPALSEDAFSVALSAFGGFILLASGILFLAVLIRGQIAQPVKLEPYRFATAIHPPAKVPAALNCLGLWVALMVGLTITNYGYPILQLALRPGGRGPRRLRWRAAMNQETPLSLKDPWVVRSVTAAAAIFVGAAVLGFVVFPLIQPNTRASGLWDAICSAAGVVREPSSEKPIEPGFTVSQAVMTSVCCAASAPSRSDAARRSPTHARFVMGPQASAAPILPISRVSTPA
jgi:hypothetical protein